VAARVHTLLARLRGFIHPAAADRDFDDEIATHLAMAEDDHVRRGMTRAAARRAARVALGGMAQLHEAGRDARGLPRLDAFGLDVTLALRRLRKDWVLTLVGGLAMATAIAILAGMVNTHQAMYAAELPLEDGDRVVAVSTFDTAANRPVSTPMGDVERWRAEVTTLREISAFRTVERGLVVGSDGRAEPVALAEITASGLELARIAPLMGRMLDARDEAPGAPPVVVIGHEPWRTLFGADPAVVGRPVLVGGVTHTVVGVMPDGFAFPVNHRFWTPLRTVARPGGPDGPDVTAFARLAPGATLDNARAEVATLGLLPLLSPAGDIDPREPRVISYAIALNMGGGDYVGLVGPLLFLITLLLLPPCANVAVLVYARAVGRQEEFAARYALGASRGRIVTQIFVELLVLSTGATVVALVAVRLAGEFMQGAVPEAPFWLDLATMKPLSIAVAAALAVAAAALAGLVPALQATGRLLSSGLRAPGSRSALRLGAAWTTLIVAQVAISLAALPMATELAWGTVRPNILGPGFAAGDYLTTRLSLDAPVATDGEADAPARLEAVGAELVRRLEAESGVAAVVLSSATPGLATPDRIETPAIDGTLRVDVNRVSPGFFDALDMALLTGRTFDAGDTGSARVVVVNRTLAELLGDDVLGRQVRYARTAGPGDAPAPWYEVVGVVDDLDANAETPALYHPLGAEPAPALSLSLRQAPGSPSVAARLLALAASVDPALRVEGIAMLDEVWDERYRLESLGGVMIGSVALSVLLLSAAGMYALMSFTVNRRRREIGIRSALGATARPLLAGIFGRAAGQLLAGAVLGAVVAPLLGRLLPLEQMGAANVPGVLPGAAALLVVIGTLAALGPARRALRVDPTEALRDG
jgi:predicted permease